MQDLETHPSASSAVLVARQPIFGRGRTLEGYELLYRSGAANECTAESLDEATLEVMSASLMHFGLERLARGKRAFINFTEPLLLAGMPTMLPADQVVVEIPVGVRADARLVDACDGLRRAGYSLALDGYTLQPHLEALLPLADIVKVDLQKLPREQWAEPLRAPHGPDVRFLAMKVETPEEHEAAEALGYHCFQGHFYARPSFVAARSLSAAEVLCLEALREIGKEDISFDRVAEIVKRDVSLSYKLMRFINSAALGLRTRVTSIRHALTLLGQKESARWLSLVALRDIGRGKPEELMVTCIVRGRMGELLAGPARLRGRASELFLLGLFSSIDALLDRPLDEAVHDLPLAADVQAALLGEPNRLRELLDLILAYERGDWARFEGQACMLGIEESTVPSIYVEAASWASGLLPPDKD